MAHPHGPGPGIRFVVVPFLPALQPALGVSSLLSVLRSRGIAGDVRYLNLEYGERVGWELYDYVAGGLPTPFLLGEALFARALWGERAPPFERYEQGVERWFQRVAALGGPGWEKPRREWERHVVGLRRAFAEAPRVVAEWATAVLADGPRVLGFTSTFQQNVAALALAQEIRRQAPAERVALVFGGANCEDDMGRALAENFSFVDRVVSGEAEEVIFDLVRDLPAGGSCGERFVQGRMVRDMDALPLPDFDDYFADPHRASLGERVWLVAESSRGCWWGAKSHCTFCGLNGGTMAFRSKSPERFASELETLSRQYGLADFALTDNILDMSYLTTLLPELVASARSYNLFYETKSNLRKDQLELLAAAGVRSLQPGIESFSTAVLKLMAKGTTRLQNVQLLKWCAELGLKVTWNFLYGFPGEEPREYEDMAELMPALFHLPPPTDSSNVRLDRFGPYWRSPERHHIRNVRRYWSYDYAFAALPAGERERLAYFFEYEYEDGRQPLDYARPSVERIADWRTAARAGARLELCAMDGAACVLDTRPCRVEEVYTLPPEGPVLLGALDAVVGRERLWEALRRQGWAIDQDRCERLLAELVERRFVIEDNGLCLSLVVDPRQRQRVEERQVSLRVARLGFRWPDDFPAPENRQLVRDAVLALGHPEARRPPAAAARSRREEAQTP